MSRRCSLLGHKPVKVDETHGFPKITEYECKRCGTTGHRLESGVVTGGRPAINWE